MNRLAKLLLVASIALFLTGIGLAVAQPGSLGGDDDVAVDDTSTTVGDARSDTTETTDPDTTDTTDPDTDTTVGDGDEIAGGTTSTTASPETGTPGSGDTTTTTSGNGSGVGSDGTGSEDDSDDLADTGSESLILAGLIVGGIGLAVRRRHLVGSS